MIHSLRSSLVNLINKTVIDKSNIMEKKTFLRENLLLFLTVASVFAGCIIGFSLRNLELTERNIDLIGFPGEILMNMLKVSYFFVFF